MLDLFLVDEGAGLYAHLPTILFGQFYLSNRIDTVLTTRYAMAVRPPLLSGSPYTFISFDLTGRPPHFPYGFVVEPDV